MRPPTLVLCCALFCSTAGLCQGPQAPKKILTPAQHTYQQQIHEVDEQRASLRAEAQHLYDAEMAHQRAGDCPKAQTTFDANTCYERAAATTDRNLKAYEGALRSLIGLQYPDFPGQTPAPGAVPNQLTPQQSAAEFEHLEQLWQGYFEAAGKAAFHQFDGGTGGPSFELQMHLRLVRSHMAELNNLYGMLLRL